jgi:predicted RNA binding protein YcfA (HicA-like mRNA interferase family)
MIRMPRYDGKTLAVILLGAGFKPERLKGSHIVIKHADGRSTTIPIHSGDPIRSKLLNAILEDCGMIPTVIDE